MRIANPALAFLLYLLVYVGLDEAVWPLLWHYKHVDALLPRIIGIGIHEAVFPFATGLLLAVALKEKFLRVIWPVAAAPLPSLSPRLSLRMVGIARSGFKPELW